MGDTEYKSCNKCHKLLDTSHYYQVKKGNKVITRAVCKDCIKDERNKKYREYIKRVYNRNVLTKAEFIERLKTNHSYYIGQKHYSSDNPFFGKHHSVDALNKNRQAHLGKSLSEETRRKMSESHRRNNIWKGRNHTEESKRKQSEVKLAEKNPVWKGGVSFEPYPVGWRKKLKLKIRERDNNTCQLCGGHIELLDVGWATHHIDYNKNNLDESNLILLCKRCHGKTNHNHRDEWIRIFTEKMSARGLTNIKK